MKEDFTGLGMWREDARMKPWEGSRGLRFHVRDIQKGLGIHGKITRREFNKV